MKIAYNSVTGQVVEEYEVEIGRVYNIFAVDEDAYTDFDLIEAAREYNSDLADTLTLEEFCMVYNNYTKALFDGTEFYITYI